MTDQPQSGTAGEPGFDRAAAGVEAREFFDRLWSESDPWKLDTSDLDQLRFKRQLELLGGRPYERALEIGCGGGRSRRSSRRRARRRSASTSPSMRSRGRELPLTAARVSSSASPM